jgi:redox-sensing transcriptional repressor
MTNGVGQEASPGVPRLDRAIPEATIERLPVYLRVLCSLAEEDTATVSSEGLSVAAGVNPAKLRKDLSHLGSYGTRGVGYDVDLLVRRISFSLGLTQNWPVMIVGVGNLGHALANYGGFSSRGFQIRALVDVDPDLRGTSIAGVEVRPLGELEELVECHSVMIGVIATPAGSAQSVSDRLVASGVASILNFAPTVLTVPPGVQLRKVDLAVELQILAFHEQRRTSTEILAMAPTVAP